MSDTRLSEQQIAGLRHYAGDPGFPAPSSKLRKRLRDLGLLDRVGQHGTSWTYVLSRRGHELWCDLGFES